jgi:Fe-S cluster assembly protein SufD
MGHVTKEQAHYLSDFERAEQTWAPREPAWVHRLRQAAMACFATQGFPTTRHEEWKYTNVAPIVKTRFTPAAYDTKGVARESLIDLSRGTLGRVQLVFVNGHYAAPLSSLHALPEGVRVGSLAAVLTAAPEQLEPHLAQYAAYQEQAFVALNTAFMEDGAFVYIPRGLLVDDPIHLLFVSSGGGEPTVRYPRNLLIVERESQATIIETYIGLEDTSYFTNAVTELVLGENSVLEHYKLQQESLAGFHVATLQVQQDRHSTFTSHAIALGGALVRNDVNVALAGEGVECTLNGLYLGIDQQHVDNHTRIDHLQPHGISRELYKGVLDGKARGVFSGKIVVHKDAQKTDATQSNKNLLLSEEARVDSKPQLEIFNNDVRCTHGSTTGQLDRDALFYLRSRGMGQQAARRLLTYAFASEMINRVKLAPLRAYLDTRLTTQLHAEPRS